MRDFADFCENVNKKYSGQSACELEIEVVKKILKVMAEQNLDMKTAETIVVKAYEDI